MASHRGRVKMAQTSAAGPLKASLYTPIKHPDKVLVTPIDQEAFAPNTDRRSSYYSLADLTNKKQTPKLEAVSRPRPEIELSRSRPATHAIGVNPDALQRHSKRDLLDYSRNDAPYSTPGFPGNRSVAPPPSDSALSSTIPRRPANLRSPSLDTAASPEQTIYKTQAAPLYSSAAGNSRRTSKRYNSLTDMQAIREGGIGGGGSVDGGASTPPPRYSNQFVLHGPKGQRSNATIVAMNRPQLQKSMSLNAIKSTVSKAHQKDIVTEMQDSRTRAKFKQMSYGKGVRPFRLAVLFYVIFGVLFVTGVTLIMLVYLYNNVALSVDRGEASGPVILAGSFLFLALAIKFTVDARKLSAQQLNQFVAHGNSAKMVAMKSSGSGGGGGSRGRGGGGGGAANARANHAELVSGKTTAMAIRRVPRQLTSTDYEGVLQQPPAATSLVTLNQHRNSYVKF